MAKNILMKVEEYKNEDIYPGESISFTVTKQDDTAFPLTSAMSVEIRDNVGTKIDTLAIARSGDNLSYPIVYTNTSDWVRKKKYNLWARYTDADSNANNVVADLTLTVK